MQDKKVNILGSEYTIKYDVPDEQMPEGSDGNYGLFNKNN